jgi:TolB protein
MRSNALALVLVAAAATLVGSPAAAADGGVLFVSNRDGSAQIYRMNVDGTGEQALTRGPAENTEPAGSPDGSHIAFTSYRDGNAEIYVMDADGGHPRRLTNDPQADSMPAWTPDGRVVFTSTRDRWTNFYVMNADGSDLRQLTASAVDKGPAVPSPDGRWIAFVAMGEKGRAEIHVMPAAGGASRDVTGALSGNGKSYPVWSPDGKRLAYLEAGGGALNLRAIDPDGTHPVKITDTPYLNAFPAWSPDGRRIAFASGREGTRIEQARADIFVMNADGSGATNLTRHPDEDNYPVWSADGRTILFVSLRDGNAQIYAVDAGGGPARRLTHNQGYDVTIRPLASPGQGRSAVALSAPPVR